MRMVKLILKLVKKMGKLFFEISNNGAPISAEVKDKLFTPFSLLRVTVQD